MLLSGLLLLFNALQDSGAEDSFHRRALKLMKEAPLIDGHNDLALKLRRFYHSKLSKANLRTIDSTLTNIQKLKAGHVGAQVWTIHLSCGSQNKDAVHLTLEQIDIIKRMCKSYDELELVTSSQGIANSDKIASLMGIHGGHAIDSSLATLRMFYDLGVRYLTLTPYCNTPWAEAASPKYGNFYTDVHGLSDFGEEVVKEMNRLGMIIDLSHASEATARAVLRISKAPVIFTHSAAFSVCNHPKNIPDSILQLLKQNNGIIMLSFDVKFLACSGPSVTVSNVADHFDHIQNTIGPEHLGIAGNYDGFNIHPVGLEDVSKYPVLIAELLKRGWSEEVLKDVLRENFLRVFREVEKVRDESLSIKANEETISPELVKHPCRQELKPPPRATILY